MTEAFTTVDRKTPADLERAKRKENNKKYLTWAEQIWPGEMIKMLNDAMSLFETHQPQKSDESDEDYTKRYNCAHDVYKSRKCSCDKPVEECIAASKFATFSGETHRNCEEHRQVAYAKYLKDPKVVTAAKKSIAWSDQEETKPPHRSGLSGFPGLPKKQEKQEIKEVLEVEQAAPKLKVRKPIVEVILPPHQRPVKPVKPKTADELEIDALCDVLDKMPERKSRRR
jgi:hypothetical protein